MNENCQHNKDVKQNTIRHKKASLLASNNYLKYLQKVTQVKNETSKKVSKIDAVLLNGLSFFPCSAFTIYTTFTLISLNKLNKEALTNLKN